MKTFKLVSWGHEYEVSLNSQKYSQNGNLAITMDYLDDEFNAWLPFANLTVNLGEKLPPNKAYVDTNNCPWAREFIVMYGLGKFTGKIGMSGWCEYPMYEFDMNKIEEVA